MYDRSSQLIESGNKEELTAYIDELSARIRDISLELVRNSLPTIPGLMVTLMGYIATQGFRLTNWLKEPHLDSIDLIAHTTRSLFEATLIYRHLMVDGGKHFMQRITKEIARDELDIIEESLRRFDPAFLPPDLVARQQKLKAYRPSKVLRVADLAEETGAKGEYGTYYKLFSKYSHPTLYLLVGDRREVYSQTVLRLLMERAVTYLEVATNDYEQLLEVAKSKRIDSGGSDMAP